MTYIYRSTKNPLTDRFESARWLEHYFGYGKWGVSFKDGTIYSPDYYSLKTRA